MVTRRDDAQLHVAGEGKSQVLAALPLPAKRGLTLAIDSATLPAAGAYTASPPYDVWKSRLVHVHIILTGPGAGAAGQQLSMVPEVCFNVDSELSDEAYFIPIGVTDGVVNNLDLAINPGGTIYTAQNMGSLDFRPLEIRTVATDTNADIVAMALNIDVTGAKWFRVKIAEIGQLANQFTAEVRFGKTA